MSSRLNHKPNASTRFMAVDEKEGSVQVPFNKLQEELGGDSNSGSDSGSTKEYIATLRYTNDGDPEIYVFKNTTGETIQVLEDTENVGFIISDEFQRITHENTYVTAQHIDTAVDTTKAVAISIVSGEITILAFGTGTDFWMSVHIIFNDNWPTDLPDSGIV